MGGVFSTYKIENLKGEQERVQNTKFRKAKAFFQGLRKKQLRNERAQDKLDKPDDSSFWSYEQLFCTRPEELKAERDDNIWPELSEIHFLEREHSEWWDKLRDDLDASLWDKPWKH